MNNVKEIARYWLEGNGYEGLYCDGCACDLTELMNVCIAEEEIPTCMPGLKTPCDCFLTDLMPCEEPTSELCVPGYKNEIPCKKIEICNRAES